MTLPEFIETQIGSLHFLPVNWRKILQQYLDGLIRGHKKSFEGIKKEFHLDVNTKNFSKTVKQLKKAEDQLHHFAFQQIGPQLDRRSKIFIAGDDTAHPVYGKNIYAASIQYDHALHASINSIKLVDIVLSNTQDRLLVNAFAIYLPHEFIAKYPWLGYQFHTKIELVSDLILTAIQRCLGIQVSQKAIWVLTDCWYVSGTFEKSLHESGVNYVLQLKKDRQIRLFEHWMRIETYFTTAKKWHYFTSGPEKKRVWYKEAILDVSQFGRRKAFLFQEEKEAEPRYFITNDFKLTAKTAYSYLKRRWTIETMHREVKQFFGLQSTYAGNEPYLRAHYIVSYFGWMLFQWYKWQREGIPEKVSTEELWLQYITERRKNEYCNQCPYSSPHREKLQPRQKLQILEKVKIPLEV